MSIVMCLKRRWWCGIYTSLMARGRSFSVSDLRRMVRLEMNDLAFSLLAERLGTTPEEHEKFINECVWRLCAVTQRYVTACGEGSIEIFLREQIDCLPTGTLISGKGLYKAIHSKWSLWGEAQCKKLAWAFHERSSITVLATTGMVCFHDFLTAVAKPREGAHIRVCVTEWSRDDTCSYWGYGITHDYGVFPHFALMKKDERYMYQGMSIPW
ncbi:MAG: hypothetical protein Q8Q94_04430 [bacterium]|nr:hypothetical protein [bacterium]MDZ4299636.1 hypothetical protein [Candidatus Sungbacteria bacterium]